MSIHELLLHNAQHGALICCQCQYAIQKFAIESHLLRADFTSSLAAAGQCKSKFKVGAFIELISGYADTARRLRRC